LALCLGATAGTAGPGVHLVVLVRRSLAKKSPNVEFEGNARRARGSTKE
jgi:hypothetical protein